MILKINGRCCKVKSLVSDYAYNRISGRKPKRRLNRLINSRFRVLAIIFQLVPGQNEPTHNSVNRMFVCLYELKVFAQLPCDTVYSGTDNALFLQVFKECRVLTFPVPYNWRKYNNPHPTRRLKSRLQRNKLKNSVRYLLRALPAYFAAALRTVRVTHPGK